MKYSILFSLFLVISLTTCDDSTSAIEEEPETLMLPFEVGQTMNYQISVYKYLDNTTEVVDTSITFTIMSDTVINGVTWYNFGGERMSYPENLMEGYYSNQTDGIHFTKILPSNSVSKSSSAPIQNSNDIHFLLGETFTNSLSENIEIFNPPTFPKPTETSAEYLIQTENLVGGVVYQGVSTNALGNHEFNYSRYFYQLFSGNQFISILPNKYEFVLSNESGVVKFQLGYVSAIFSTENDPRLYPHITYTFELLGEGID